MNGLVIGLVGAAGSGKDTLANILIAEHGFAKLMFAAPLKRLCCEAFGWEMDRLDELKYKEAKTKLEKPHAPGQFWTRREILQHVGTEGFRAIDPLHWVRLAQREAMEQLARQEEFGRGRGVVFTDLRFQDEADMVRDVGGIVVRMTRLGGPRGTEHSGHSSESGVYSIGADAEVAVPFGRLDEFPGRAAAVVAIAERARYEKNAELRVEWSGVAR